MKRYCLYCGLAGDDIGKYPCRCSPIGSHRIVIKGEKQYRVRKIGGDGYIYLFSEVPEDYVLVETITY